MTVPYRVQLGQRDRPGHGPSEPGAGLSGAERPDLVVLGDLFTALPPCVVDDVRAMVHERSLVSRAVGGTRIETSPLGRDAKLVGAAELAFEPVLGAV